MTNFFRFNNIKTTFSVFQFLVRRQVHQKPSQSQVKIVCPGKPKPLIDFDCKIALITGGSDGIGLAIAHELLTEKVKNIVLVGINNCRGRESVLELNRTYGKGKSIFINCDVQSKIQVQDCYSKVIKEFGKLDIVVNAAGIFDGCNWEKELMTNLAGTVNSMLQAYKVMSKEESGNGGVILNVAGLHGIKPLPPAPTLSASLHGIVGLSRSCGHEANFKNTAVRVVSLCPGITNTDYVKEAEKRGLTEKMGQQLNTLLKKIKRQNPDVCGQSAIYVLKHGMSGSVWVVDGSKLYSLKIPSWKQYRVLESQLI